MQLVQEHAQCRGLNTRLSAKGAVMTISQVLPPESTSIPLSEVRAIELVMSSVFPPLSLFLLGVIVLIAVWWIAGRLSWPIIPLESYKSITSWAILAIALGLATTMYAWLFAKLRIVTTNHSMMFTVHMVPRRSGERFVDCLRHMMRST